MTNGYLYKHKRESQFAWQYYTANTLHLLKYKRLAFNIALQPSIFKKIPIWNMLNLCIMIRWPPLFRQWIRKKYVSYIQINTVHNETHFLSCYLPEGKSILITAVCRKIFPIRWEGVGRNGCSMGLNHLQVFERNLATLQQEN